GQRHAAFIQRLRQRRTHAAPSTGGHPMFDAKERETEGRDATVAGAKAHGAKGPAAAAVCGGGTRVPVRFGGASSGAPVEFRGTGEPVAMGYCHCNSCRRWSAG